MSCPSLYASSSAPLTLKSCWKETMGFFKNNTKKVLTLILVLSLFDLFFFGYHLYNCPQNTSLKDIMETNGYEFLSMENKYDKFQYLQSISNWLAAILNVIFIVVCYRWVFLSKHGSIHPASLPKAIFKKIISGILSIVLFMFLVALPAAIFFGSMVDPLYKNNFIQHNFLDLKLFGIFVIIGIYVFLRLSMVGLIVVIFPAVIFFRSMANFLFKNNFLQHQFLDLILFGFFLVMGIYVFLRLSMIEFIAMDKGGVFQIKKSWSMTKNRTRLVFFTSGSIILFMIPLFFLALLLPFIYFNILNFFFTIPMVFLFIFSSYVYEGIKARCEVTSPAPIPTTDA
jgi:hypothetical protein